MLHTGTESCVIFVQFTTAGATVAEVSQATIENASDMPARCDSCLVLIGQWIILLRVGLDAAIERAYCVLAGPQTHFHTHGLAAHLSWQAATILWQQQQRQQQQHSNIHCSRTQMTAPQHIHIVVHSWSFASCPFKDLLIQELYSVL